MVDANDASNLFNLRNISCTNKLLPAHSSLRTILTQSKRTSNETTITASLLRSTLDRSRTILIRVVWAANAVFQEWFKFVELRRDFAAGVLSLSLSPHEVSQVGFIQ